MVISNFFKFKLKTNFSTDIVDSNYQFCLKFNLLFFDQVIISQTTEFLCFISKEIDIELKIRENDIFPMCVLEIEFISDDLSQDKNPVIIKEYLKLTQNIHNGIMNLHFR